MTQYQVIYTGHPKKPRQVLTEPLTLAEANDVAALLQADCGLEGNNLKSRLLMLDFKLNNFDQDSLGAYEIEPILRGKIE